MKKQQVRVLDVGCGPLSFGSPTMHDLWDAIVACGKEPNMTGIDTVLPSDTQYPIRYLDRVDDVTETFDIVRLLHIVEHLSPKEYYDLRKQAVARVRNGGDVYCFAGSWILETVLGRRGRQTTSESYQDHATSG